MYGYRYRHDSPVLSLPGRDLAAAVAEVITRRQRQAENHNPITVELVERDGDEWRPVPLSDEGGGVL